jgi:asparagine synthase (glutamine-hydrolysing)
VVTPSNSYSKLVLSGGDLERLTSIEPAAQDARGVLLAGLELLVDNALAAAPTRPVGLLLSGGLDSSLLGALLARAGAAVVAFTAGEKGSADLEAARAVAGALDVELVPCLYDKRFVSRELPALARFLSFRGLHTLAIGVLLEACLRQARRRGVSDIWAGNGLDLIFGGGIKAEPFAAAAGHKGKSFHDEFWDHTLPLVKGWYGAPDPINVYGQLGAKYGTRFHLPFESLQAIELARSIDARTFFAGGVDKAPLRTVAADLGIPHAVACREKAMFQESSGLFEMLRAMAIERVCDLAPDQLSCAYDPHVDRDLTLRYFVATLAASEVAADHRPMQPGISLPSASPARRDESSMKPG